MRSITILVAILVISCNTPQNNSSDKGQKDGLVKTYSKEGKLVSEINFKDGKRNGIGKSYYKNGNVQLEIPYKDGKREGVVRRFYENGKLYQETEFLQDQQSGWQITYKEDGKKKAEARYEAGEPCTGLKEYLLNGTLKKEYPSIVTRIVDRVRERGEYIVYLSLSNGSRKVKFYRGELSKNGCLTNLLIPLPFNSRTKQGELRYTLPVGSFIMEEVNIVAEATTLTGNSYLIQRKINIALDN